jgi:acyl carrier protein
MSNVGNLMLDNSPRPTVRAFIVENLFLGDDTTIRDGDSLLEAGALDSTGVMELVEFLETHFSIKIDNDEISPDNFDTVDRIVAFIERKSAPVLAR